LEPEQEQNSAPSSSNKNDYKVGYKKPPKATQFKKGQSGNPAGSKKAERIDDLRIVTEAILDEPVVVREGGRVRRMTRLEAIIHAHGVNALKGKSKAIRTLLRLARKTGMFTEAKRKSLMVITEPDGEHGKVIRMFHAEQEALKRSADGLVTESRNATRSDEGR
jgi:hypothetical protein